jgi:membrane associated rhomboid family serine protease
VTTPLSGAGEPQSRKQRARADRQRARDELAATSLLRSVRPTSASGAAVVMLTTLAVLWLVVGLNAAVGHRLLRFGIKPRQFDGLGGIVVSPFLHTNAAHLLANSIPLAVLGWLMLTSGLRYFFLVTGAVLLAAGLIDWLVGPSDEVIVGASGVIFGWFGYVLARAFFARSLKWIAIAIAVAAVFSSMFTGMLPKINSNVFWGGHVAGFVVGVAVAALLHRKRPPRAGKPAGARPRT